METKESASFVWNDGGRSASGFVGIASDCVTRAIAIATGTVYRDVYGELGELEQSSARNGISSHTIGLVLTDREWIETRATGIERTDLPSGVVVVEFEPRSRKRTGHLSCVIDHAVHDTWDPFDDPSFQIVKYWTPPPTAQTDECTPVLVPGTAPRTKEAVRRQDEYDKIVRRVKALQRTAREQRLDRGGNRDGTACHAGADVSA